MFGYPIFVALWFDKKRSQCMEDVMAVERASGEGLVAVASTRIPSSSSR